MNKSSNAGHLVFNLVYSLLILRETGLRMLVYRKNQQMSLNATLILQFEAKYKEIYMFRLIIDPYLSL